MPGLKSAGKLFDSREDFQDFHPTPYKTLFFLGMIYVAILFSLLIVWQVPTFELHPSIVACVYTLIFFVIGWSQFALSNGLHEALHKNLFNKNSDLIAAIITAYPIGLTMSYRDVHQAHHKHLGTAKDPDLTDYINFPKSKLGLISRFLFNLSGIPAITQFFKLMFGEQKVTRANNQLNEIIGLVIVQTFILVIFFALFNSVFYYFFFWILPVITVGKFCSSTRLLCEHGSPDHEWVIRSIHGPRVKTWVLGPFDFNYHAEHHLAQTIPFPSLEKLYDRHQDVVSRAKTEDLDYRVEIFEGGYLSLIWSWFMKLPWTTTNALR